MTDAADLLRSLKVLQGPLPPFDVDNAPENPIVLFREWLDRAIAENVSEPHAMTLSTVDGDGLPDARILILKNVDEGGFYFAMSIASRKSSQLSEQPKAAITFHWKEQARQIRIRGPVVDQGDAASARDYLARPESSRAAAVLGKQSQILDDPADLYPAIATALAKVKADPDFVTPLWRLKAVEADEVEFWQGTATRNHERLCYRRCGKGYEKFRLWPQIAFRRAFKQRITAQSEIRCGAQEHEDGA
jgi:pyridoxamine 5'-phosphate oxidase